ncbi:MAG: hypothetical protein HY323_07280 [Betaproteobacteria bacterium]|nr:hypothetical protein [Betaproteobacteria bacterium]
MAIGQRSEQVLRIVGAEEVRAALAELPAALSREIVMGALTAAGRPIARAATANLRATLRPVAGGRKGLRGLARNSLRRGGVKVLRRLTRSQARYRGVSTQEAAVFVGPTASTGHLIEFGTKERATKGRRFTGRFSRRGRIFAAFGRKPHPTGRVTARRYLQRAWDAGKVEAARSIGAELWRAMERKVRQLARRQAKILTKIGAT